MRSRRYYKKLSEAGRKAARVRWDADRKRRDAEEPARVCEAEIAEVTGEGRALRPGEYFGTIEYRERSGKVHRITLRQGKRKNSFQIDGCENEHGKTWVLDKLRRKIIT